MSRLSCALAAALTLSLVPAAPAFTAEAIHLGSEDFDARQQAAVLALAGLEDVEAQYGNLSLKPGQFRWSDDGAKASRVVVNLNEQLLFVYSGSDLIAVSTISSGTAKNPTPSGIFPIMEKRRMHRSNRYNDAPMPFMQRLDNYGIALHAGELPGYPASHGCIRLPREFAAKLFAATEVGTEVLVGAYVE